MGFGDDAKSLSHVNKSRDRRLNSSQWQCLMPVNSMPDEYTNSQFTWFNSPLRGRQYFRTLADMVKVGQWHGRHQGGKAPPPEYQPAVKFWMVGQELLEHLQSSSEDRGGDGSDSSGSESDDESDGTEDIVMNAQSSRNQRAAAVTASFLFVDPLVDLKSRALLDMLSDNPLLTPETSPQPLSIA